MKRKIITTSDGSKTIQIEDWNEQYHSIHGAIQEANHVFIKHGLFSHPELVSGSHQEEHNTEHRSLSEVEVSRNPVEVSSEQSQSKVDESHPINILEIGFGTGLNAFLTLIQAEQLKRHIHYVGVEAYPVEAAEIEQLNYVELISQPHQDEFEQLHGVSWEAKHNITPFFQLEKQQKFFKEIETKNTFDIIYFDAFGARVQPELWTEAIFAVMFKALKENGILVTYSAKGSVRRAMETVGFTVERLPGPPGKREMLRAQRKSS
ncbi:MAG: tRNA (5-methylaminomethyl-2-thiouridine)(34)-methyltransferase MnmD [Bacteroidota bacterium]